MSSYALFWKFTFAFVNIDLLTGGAPFLIGTFYIYCEVLNFKIAFCLLSWSFLFISVTAAANIQIFFGAIYVHFFLFSNFYAKNFYVSVLLT